MRRFVALGVLALASVFIAAAQGAPQASGDYIVVLKSGADSAAVAAKHKQKHGAEPSFVYKHALKGYAAALSPKAVSALADDPEVAFVAVDEPVAAAQIVGRGVNRIDGDLSSTLSGNGSGTVNVNVAVLDTGISTHPDRNVVGGVNCTNDKGGFDDPNGHGSLAGGVIGDLDNSTDSFVGVAPGARLWAVRVLRKNGMGTTAMVICGIDWVTSTRTDADTTNDIAVANMSLGGKGQDDGNCGLTNRDAEHQAICRSVAAGVTYVVSAGNEARDFARATPAAYDEVLTATAMGDTDGQPGALGGLDVCGDGQADDVATTFSNFATTTADQAHTIAAPGACIEASYIDNGFGHASGTSFAAPLVAGTVSLCIAAGPCAGLTPAQIIQKIVADAAAYNAGTPSYGFQGDPLRPISGKYYGYLIRAAQY